MEPVGSLYDVLVTWPVVNTASYAQCYTYTHTGNTNNRLPLIIYSTCGAQTESNNWRLLANTTLHNACASFRAAAYTQFGAMKSKHCNKSCTRRYAAAATEIHKSSVTLETVTTYLAVLTESVPPQLRKLLVSFVRHVRRRSEDSGGRQIRQPQILQRHWNQDQQSICICCGSSISGAFGN